MAKHLQANAPVSQSYTSVNIDPRKGPAVSPGFQRIELGNKQPHERDMLRMVFQGSGADTTFQPSQRQDLHNFRDNSVTACLEMAAVTTPSSSTTPILVHWGPYQNRSISMSSTQPSMATDSVVACLTPGSSVQFMPTPSSSGAQVITSNLLGQPQRLWFTDLQNNTLANVTSYYVSLALFERV